MSILPIPRGVYPSVDRISPEKLARRGIRLVLADLDNTLAPYKEAPTPGAAAWARELEAQTGQAASSQAVGGAVGHNPISIVIPCHRVVGSGGNLTGYAGGLDRKVRLLELEGADMSRLSPPKAGR